MEDDDNASVASFDLNQALSRSSTIRSQQAMQRTASEPPLMQRPVSDPVPASTSRPTTLQRSTTFDVAMGADQRRDSVESLNLEEHLQRSNTLRTPRTPTSKIPKPDKLEQPQRKYDGPSLSNLVPYGESSAVWVPSPHIDDDSNTESDTTATKAVKTWSTPLCGVWRAACGATCCSCFCPCWTLGQNVTIIQDEVYLGQGQCCTSVCRMGPAGCRVCWLSAPCMCFVPLWWPTPFFGAAACSYRAVIARRAGIRSRWADRCLGFWCYPLTLAQERVELLKMQEEAQSGKSRAIGPADLNLGVGGLLGPGPARQDYPKNTLAKPMEEPARDDTKTAPAVTDASSSPATAVKPGKSKKQKRRKGKGKKGKEGKNRKKQGRAGKRGEPGKKQTPSQDEGVSHLPEQSVPGPEPKAASEMETEAEAEAERPQPQSTTAEHEGNSEATGQPDTCAEQGPNSSKPETVQPSQKRPTSRRKKGRGRAHRASVRPPLHTPGTTGLWRVCSSVNKQSQPAPSGSQSQQAESSCSTM